jgi:very-long-chain (3R)-3-hydroxyacyl-CoA dehydratase
MASNMARNDEKRDAAASPRKIYLTIYNITFAALWFSLLITTIITLPKGRLAVFAATSSQARWVQTASLIEVLHAATGTHSVSNASVSELTTAGIIKSPVSTTALQVVTRVIQVWMVWYCFPQSTAESYAYCALVLAWSIADTIRYLYLALNMHGKASGWLVWLR